MPLRLIWYILILICLFTFVGLNLGNMSDVNIWFTEAGHFKDVPIVISFFVMYILGALSVIPYLIGSGLKQQKQKKQLKRESLPGAASNDDKKKSRKLLKKKVEKTEEPEASKPELL
ncbi:MULTISPECIES: hypothetical protein [unclassified Oceanispirochaeta]|uniref:hypothetical protein n=1 Tax=unclassified Oceanispirochaeta TaxID=2635722 RepID=UPI000E08FF76|nr:MULTISPECIES: hypothetical protein [unclassified Oceanispirochaeta]MBF9015089.1 hypothetical protein [Oceanispirochaeta sp. M2]NPD71547.1 hypothetical protein [Oceanispirochaeta sp. M1]RDG33117.1 hypothetical protein DV872_05480 [Oceanispirochaeta sp. M1]